MQSNKIYCSNKLYFGGLLLKWSSHRKGNMGLILGETISSVKTVWKKEVIHPLNKKANSKTNMQV